jgi:hypothetical protein
LDVAAGERGRRERVERRELAESEASAHRVPRALNSAAVSRPKLAPTTRPTRNRIIGLLPLLEGRFGAQREQPDGFRMQGGIFFRIRPGGRRYATRRFYGGGRSGGRSGGASGGS